MLRVATLAAALVFLWAAGPARAVVMIDVDLEHQRMHVSSANGASYDWPISSGRPGHGTPTGRYRPQMMFPMVYSFKYENEPMPFSIFFRGQYAIHGTIERHELGQPASHGCVRISPEDAALLYDLVAKEGAEIDIHGAPPLPVYDPAPAELALAPPLG